MRANPLSASDREEIRTGIEVGRTDTAIARRIGRRRCTISSEINRDGGRDRHRATTAQTRAVRRRARPKTTILASDNELRWQVTKRLLVGDSPMTISIELARGTHGYSAQISHETICQAIYQPSRSGLCARSYKLLQRRRPRRRTPAQRHGKHRCSPLGVFNAIATQPAAADDRIEVGHLERDQIIGARNASAVITMVERATRYLWLAAHDLRSGGYSANSTTDTVVAVLQTIPPVLRRSLTSGRGSAMANHHTIA